MANELSAQAGFSRRHLLRAGATGLGVLGVTLALGGLSPAGAAPEATETGPPTGTNPQTGWRFCHQCYGMWWPSSGGYCYGNPQGPSYGPHFVGSSDYYFYAYRANNGEQSDWRYCSKCHLMFYSSGGRCPAGGAHSGGSTNYGVYYSSVFGPTLSQEGFGYCSQCRGLWYSTSFVKNKGACPGYNGHAGYGDDTYRIAYTS